MQVTQKNQYALRAVFELAKHKQAGPLKTAHIAEAQAIPVRFLEIILNHLKHAGLVTSKRGIYGGYRLKRSPEKISVGDIFRALDHGRKTSACVSCLHNGDCAFDGDCAFIPLWEKIQASLDDIYDRTTIQSLLDDHKKSLRQKTVIRKKKADKS